MSDAITKRIDLERRLLAAWAASGMPLGRLMVYAANEHALGAAISLPGLADEALVEMAERWLHEHPLGNS